MIFRSTNLFPRRRNSARSSRRILRRRLGCETLESRRLLAVTAALTSVESVQENGFVDLIYTLTRDGDLSEPLTVKYQLSGTATVDDDYDIETPSLVNPAGEGTVTFEATEATVDVRVDVANDLDLEGHETVTLTVLASDEFSAVNGSDFDTSGEDPVLYAVDKDNRLATIDIDTGSVSVVATMTLETVAEEMTDIAIKPDGSMFGISQNRTYSIDKATGAVTFLGFHSMPGLGNALASDSSGQLYAASNSSTFVYEIDSTTGVGTAFRNVGFISSGDLVFRLDDLYMSATNAMSDDDDIIEIEGPIATGVIRNQGSLENPDVFGLAYEPGTMLGLAGRKVININQFSFNVADRFNLTGQAYDVGSPDSATGTILDDEVEPVFVVNSTDDGGDTNPGNGIAEDVFGNTTLRAAIEEANASANEPMSRDRIEFNIPGFGSKLISLGSALPTITDPLVIDATSQPGHISNPIVQVDGGGTIARGLQITAGNSDISGLSITGFSTAGIELAGADSSNVVNNFVGIDPTQAAAGNEFGIRVLNSSINTISNNRISGNARSGVLITGATATSNTVSSNHIGTNAAGDSAIPNGTDGVSIFAPNNTITNNVISGNARWGVLTRHAHAMGNSISANRIGTNAASTTALPNLTGVTLQSASNEVLLNTISGNHAFGVAINQFSANSNTVRSNRIGTNTAGNGAIGNGKVGVRITQGSDNTVQLNTISGNVGQGVLVALPGTNNNDIENNRIGTDQNGMVAISNGSDGIRVVQSAAGTTIQSNTISGNGGRGIMVDGPATTGTRAVSNLVGVTANSLNPLHNGPGGGIRILSPSTDVASNTISSIDTGIVAFRDGTDADITGNAIGINQLQTATFGMNVGILITSGANDATISGNVITDNNKGVVVTGSAQRAEITNNAIFGNTVIGIDLRDDGVTPNDPTDADVGPNRRQNKPEISSATLVGGDLSIQYLVPTAVANADYPLRIEFYEADALGQGERFLGSDVYEAANAAGSKTVSVSVVGVAVGDNLVAVAIDAQGNTSEFSLVATVV